MSIDGASHHVAVQRSMNVTAAPVAAAAAPSGWNPSNGDGGGGFSVGSGSGVAPNEPKANAAGGQRRATAPTVAKTATKNVMKTAGMWPQGTWARAGRAGGKSQHRVAGLGPDRQRIRNPPAVCPGGLA